MTVKTDEYNPALCEERHTNIDDRLHIHDVDIEEVKRISAENTVNIKRMFDGLKVVFAVMGIVLTPVVAYIVYHIVK